MIAITSEKLYEEIKKLSNSPSELLDEAQTRELLQEFFDRSLTETPSGSLKSAFSLLRKINKNKNEDIKRINFSELISRLTFCFDLIYAESDKRILFISECEDITVCAKPEKISLSFLNILLSLIESCDSAYYFVNLEKIDERVLIKIEFYSERFSPEKYFFLSDGGDYIKSIGGNTLFLCENSFIRAVIAVPTGNYNGFSEYRVPEIEDLLFDRLSVVYSSLF